MPDREPVPVLFPVTKGQPPHWLRDLTPEEIAQWRKARADYEALGRPRKPAEPSEVPGSVDIRA